jgi:hypothetical protein
MDDVKRGKQEVPVITIADREKGVDPRAADHGPISSTTQEEIDRQARRNPVKK